MSVRTLLTNVNEYLYRVGLSIVIGLIVYQVSLPLLSNAEVALALMGAVFIANLFAPGIVTGTTLTAIAAILTYGIVSRYESGANLPYMNLILAETVLLILSYAIPLYVYTRTRTSAALAWGVQPFFIGSALLARDLMPSLTSGSFTTSELALLTVEELLSTTPLLTMMNVATLGLTGVSINRESKWILVGLTPLSYLSLLGISWLIPRSLPTQADELASGIIVIMGSLALFLVNQYEGSLIKLASIAPILLVNFSLAMLYSSLGLLETSISPALAYVGAIAASVVLAVPESIYRFGKLKEEKQLFFQKRINILEDINVLNSELTKILKNVKTIERVMDLDEAYSTSLNNAKARLNELSNRVVSCKVGDLECLNEIQSEVEKVKDNIKSVVSDVLFDARAINANLIASAKNLGVVTENVNVPRENEIEFKDLDKQLEETTRQISENLSRIRSSILNLNNILSNLLGLNLEIEGIEFYSVKDLQSRLKTIDLSNVVTELNSCISYARSSIDIIMDPKTRAELLDGLSRASLLPVSYAKFELSYNVMKKLIDNLGESLENILTSLHELEKSIQLREIEERESIVKQAISALYQNAPTCRRLKELNSYRPELMKAIDLIKSRDALLALNNLTNNILPILRAKKALPINSLGLKEEFVPIFVSLLKSKGLSVRIEGDQLVAE